MDAPPVDGLGAEVEARLDLETIHIEAVAGLDENSVLAVQIGILDGVDGGGAGEQIPGDGAGRWIEPRLCNDRERADRTGHHIRALGRHQVLGDQLLRRQFQGRGHHQHEGSDIQDGLAIQPGLLGHCRPRLAQVGHIQGRAGGGQVLVIGMEQRRAIAHGRVIGDDTPDHITLESGGGCAKQGWYPANAQATPNDLKALGEEAVGIQLKANFGFGGLRGGQKKAERQISVVDAEKLHRIFIPSFDNICRR